MSGPIVAPAVDMVSADGHCAGKVAVLLPRHLSLTLRLVRKHCGDLHIVSGLVSYDLIKSKIKFR